MSELDSPARELAVDVGMIVPFGQWHRSRQAKSPPSLIVAGDIWDCVWESGNRVQMFSKFRKRQVSIHGF